MSGIVLHGNPFRKVDATLSVAHTDRGCSRLEQSKGDWVILEAVEEHLGSYASPVATKIFTPHRWHPALEGFDDFLRQLYRLDAHTITVLSGRRYRKTHSSELGRRIRGHSYPPVFRSGL